MIYLVELSMVQYDEMMSRLRQNIPCEPMYSTHPSVKLLTLSDTVRKWSAENNVNYITLDYTAIKEHRDEVYLTLGFDNAESALLFKMVWL